jgi:hypothetical protein
MRARGVEESDVFVQDAAQVTRVKDQHMMYCFLCSTLKRDVDIVPGSG